MLNNDKPHRVIFVGQSGSGKTNLLNMLKKAPFNDTHENTIGVEFVKILLSQVEENQTRTRNSNLEENLCKPARDEGFGLQELAHSIRDRKADPQKDRIDPGLVSVKPPKPAYLEVWELAGGEMFREMSVTYYRTAALIVIGVDITDADAVKDARFWITQARIYLRRSHGTQAERAADTELLLVANKTDRCADPAEEEAKSAELEKLALEHEIMYLKFSAKDGHRDVLMGKILEAYQKAIIRIDHREELFNPRPPALVEQIATTEGLVQNPGIWSKVKNIFSSLKRKLLA